MASAASTREAVLSRYEVVIGLEVHCQLSTRTKIFCGCRNRFGDEPNTNVCPVCLGLPGALPVPEPPGGDPRPARGPGHASARCSPRSVFARKNYFYPDLPKGYQISQYERARSPRAAHVEIAAARGRARSASQRIHMEEDAGKLLHEGHAWSAREERRRLQPRGRPPHRDRHRAGPAQRRRRPPSTCAAFEGHPPCTPGSRTCNMEEGSLRCDANVSIRPPGRRRPSARGRRSRT